MCTELWFEGLLLKRNTKEDTKKKKQREKEGDLYNPDPLESLSSWKEMIFQIQKAYC